MKNTGDNIYSESGLWSFGGDTPSKFDDHVSKSVPLYKEGHQLVCALSEFFVPQNGNVLHIGSSTGVLTDKIANTLKSRNVNIKGLEIESEMIREAENRKYENEILFINDDITVYDIGKNCNNLIVSYYTIQFIHPSLRQNIIDKIYQSLMWGGAFIMFEKVRGSDARFQDIFNSFYQDYKLMKGYSSDEIIAKQRSLKSILEPFSREGNIDMLKRAGFVDIESVMKYTCFEGFLAIK
tara:strand:- start:3478 stop:4191 length:714 start_codon:yes stop_codon:yes gene_type:complete